MIHGKGLVGTAWYIEIVNHVRMCAIDVLDGWTSGFCHLWLSKFNIKYISNFIAK